MSSLEFKLIALNTLLLVFVVIIIYYRFNKCSWLVSEIYDGKYLKKQERYLKIFIFFITFAYYMLSNYFIFKIL